MRLDHPLRLLELADELEGDDAAMCFEPLAHDLHGAPRECYTSPRDLALETSLPERLLALVAQRLLVLVEAGLHPPLPDLDVAAELEQILLAFRGRELQRHRGL